VDKHVSRYGKESDNGKIYEHLEKHTNSFSDDEIILQDLTAELLLDLCRGERKWAFLTEEERKKMTKNRLIQDLREPRQYLKAVLTKKRISYLRKGKMTFTHSFKLLPHRFFSFKYENA